MTEELKFEEVAQNADSQPSPGIYDLLRKRHEGNEWVLIEEVSPGLRNSNRYADAVAVNLWLTLTSYPTIWYPRLAHVPIATVKMAIALENLNGYADDAALGRVRHLAKQLEDAAASVRAGISAFVEVSAPSEDNQL